MNKKNVYTVMIIIIIVNLGVIAYRYFGTSVSVRQKAYEAYLNGEEAKTLAERKKAFNASLKDYMRLKEEYDPTMGNGKLFFNIANTYFQLEQYPQSILYYYKAKKLRPRDDHVIRNLGVAKQKLGLEKTAPKSLFQKIFFFHAYLSTPEKLQFFFVLSLFIIVFYTIYIWTRKNSMKLIGHIGFVLTSLFFISLIYVHYMEPLEGVLMRSSSLLRGPATYYSEVLKEPVGSGSKVRVVDIQDQGVWLKVETDEGSIGFVSNKEIRII